MSLKNDKIKKYAYEIYETNKIFGIKSDSISDWLRAEERVEEEDMRELRKHIENLRETWLWVI